MPDLGRRRRPDVAFPWHAGWDMNDVTVLVFSPLVFLVGIGVAGGVEVVGRGCSKGVA
jgi:hypothetical protein